MQMQLVTMQWLATNHPAFHEEFISYSVLEKVIRQNVHKVCFPGLAQKHFLLIQVELTHLGDIKDPNMVLPRNSRLYTKKEPSDKFILILEGRALVTIGQTEMTFEAGPWHCFGNELLDRLHQITNNMRSGQPTQSPRSSHGALAIGSTAASNSTAAISQLTEVDMKKISFIPDFTATIRDDCTFLEISAQTYLLAYKSTLINKNRPDGDGKDGFMNDLEEPKKEEIPLNKITSEGHLKEDTVNVAIKSNGSIKRRNVSPLDCFITNFRFRLTPK